VKLIQKFKDDDDMLSLVPERTLITNRKKTVNKTSMSFSTVASLKYFLNDAKVHLYVLPLLCLDLMSLYVCMYVCRHVCMYACRRVCIHACMHICIYANSI
jgi:hypothetical protein